MSDSFVKLPSKLLFNPEISSLELRLLGVLMFHAAMNKTEPGHIKYGAEKLGKQIGVGRIACRKALLNLENFRLIKIKHRGNLANESYGLSNDIELTVSDGLKVLENGGSPETGDQYLNDTGNQYLNDTGNQYLNDTGYPYLKDTGVYLKDTGHIDDRFKINLDLNKPRARGSAPAPAHTREQNEPADVAAGRTMPDGDANAVAQNSAKEVQAAPVQTELEDFCLVSAFFDVFPELKAWVNFSRIENYLCLQPVGKIAEKRVNIAGTMIREWFENKGVKNLAFVPSNQILKGQILKGSAA